MGKKCDVRNRFIKMHIVIDSRTMKIYAASITDEKSGNTPEFKKLLYEALQNIENSTNVIHLRNYLLDVMVHIF